MKMKKWTVLVVAALLAVLSACGNGNSSSKEDDNVLHVGATGQSYPFAYKENGKLTGFDVEVMEAVAKKIDMKLDWKLLEFSGLMGELQTGKLDTISNQVAVTDERKETYNFTKPYAYAGTQIVVKKDNTDIKSVDDLKGKTVAAVLGSNHAKNLESKDPDKKINIKTYETQEGTLKDVAYLPCRRLCQQPNCIDRANQEDRFAIKACRRSDCLRTGCIPICQGRCARQAPQKSQ